MTQTSNVMWDDDRDDGDDMSAARNDFMAICELHSAVSANGSTFPSAPRRSLWKTLTASLDSLGLMGGDSLRSVAESLTSRGMACLDERKFASYSAPGALCEALCIYQTLASATPVDVTAAHLRLGKAFWRVGKLEEGHEQCQRALMWLKTSHCCYKNHEYNLGSGGSNDGDDDDGTIHSSCTASTTKEKDDELEQNQPSYSSTLAKCYRLLGHTSLDTATALGYYKRELNIHLEQQQRRNNDYFHPESLASVHVEIACCLCSMGGGGGSIRMSGYRLLMLERSLEHNREALQITQNRKLTVDIYINLAMVYFEMERNAEARKYLLQAKDILERGETKTRAPDNDENNYAWSDSSQQMLFICANLGRLDDTDRDCHRGYY